MNLFKLVLILLFLCIQLNAKHRGDTSVTVEEGMGIHFSKAEKAFLKKKTNITMCVDPDWLPYESIKNGKHIGISAEYMKQISDIIQTPITLVRSKTWSESLAIFKNGRCDILSLVAPTLERKPYMTISKPYVTIPLVIATTKETSYISDISRLKEKKIGFIKDYASNEILQKKYLDIAFIPQNTLSDCLEKVSDHILFACVDTLDALSYQIQKRFPTQLKISGQVNEKISMGVGVQKNEPLLLNIFNVAIDLVNEDVKQTIFNDWTPVRFEQTSKDEKILKTVLLPILIIGILLFLSHYVLRQYNKKLKKQVSLSIERLREKDEILIQKQRMSDMGELLSMIAHQWKQPLGAINSTIMGINIKIASGKYNLDHPSDQKDFLEYLENKFNKITDYVQHLSTTTDDFRHFFNPNKSKELTSLAFPIESALKLVEDSMNKQHIIIETDIQTNPEFKMYQNEIMQVIMNLLKNSEYNFLNKNIHHPKITIATFKRKDKIVISVCDNGGGIPKDIAKKVFEPYFSTKNEKNGTGLGLYMSRIIIEDHHNGSLKMMNKDKGVCFEMIFSALKTTV